MDKMTYDELFYNMATLISQKSGDLSTKVGCVVVDERNSVLTLGWNDLPRGVKDCPDRRERPAKYLYTEHAERNAIYNAASVGVSLKGGKLYCTMFPCADCARGIIQSGITTVIAPKPDLDDEHRKVTSYHAVSIEMLSEAGITIHYRK